MATINCNSCSDLIETAPEFMSKGVTDTVCESLANNTGLNPSLSVLHDNCEDFETMNECMIGKKALDLKSYSSCDWKEFTKGLIENLFQYFKALNCSLCGLWKKVTCVYNGIVKLIDALDGSVGGSSFVTYYRDNSGTGEGYDWSPVVGQSYNLEFYMDANLDDPGSTPADRDYVVICQVCTDYDNVMDIEVQTTFYSSGDTRTMETIRRRQAQHPAIYATSLVNNFSWPVTSSVLIRKGEHIKLEGYCDRLNDSPNARFRYHQITCTWIPIAPTGGWDLSDILDC